MENELAHHGILGMKWGRRRYQNADGSRTAAGKARENDDGPGSSKKTSVKDMSDDELRKAVNRLQLEKQYSDLSSKDVARGKAYMDKIIKGATTVAAVTTTGLTIYKNVDKIKTIVSKTAKKAS